MGTKRRRKPEARKHRMKQRAGYARYWDCVHCGQFLCDMRPVPRKRIMPVVAERMFGPCRASLKGGG